MCVKMKNGSFNWCFKVVFKDGTAWAVRYPAAGQVLFPEEKVRREVAVMTFLREKTRVPVPKVIAFGIAVGNHDPDMGPFIITEWIEDISLSSVMEELPRPEWGPVLRKDISDDMLFAIYRQVARIILEIPIPSFDQIGSLSMTKLADDTYSWHVKFTPMTLKTNEIERSVNVKVGGKSS
jgi:aminoglycoside phosphotransferase (APT) family kinase protein